MSKKRLGGIVWTVRNRGGLPRLLVRWHEDMMQVSAWSAYGGMATVHVPNRDVRRLLRLMQRALDWRYGKRKEGGKP